MDLMWLVFAHFIGDVALQTKFQAENKHRFWLVMLGHCLVWTGCICAALQYLGLLTLPKLLFLVGTHWLMDFWQGRYAPRGRWRFIYLDQGFHILQVALVYLA